MIENYIIVGSNWTAKVNISDLIDIPDDQIKIEACTRAVEQHFGKRSDIPYIKNKKITLTKEQKKDELLFALTQLLTTELEPGCGIGAVLCITDDSDPQTRNDGKSHEWFINSNKILENVGMPNLVKMYNLKFPSKKIEKC